MLSFLRRARDRALFSYGCSVFFAQKSVSFVRRCGTETSFYVKEGSASPVARHFFLNKNNILLRHPHRFFCAKFHTPRHLLRKNAGHRGRKRRSEDGCFCRKSRAPGRKTPRVKTVVFTKKTERAGCRVRGRKRGCFDTTRCAFMKKRHKTFLYVRLRESMAHRNPIFRAAFSRNPCFPGARSGLERIAGFFRGWECAGLARLFLTKWVRYAIIE